MNTKSAKVDHGAEVAAEHRIARSPHWPAVEKAVLAASPKCIACDDTVALQLHHRHPFHFVVAVGRGDLELDPRNLVALCETEENKPEENHHLLIGHAGDFKKENPFVVEDAKALYGLKGVAIHSSAVFQERLKNPMKKITEFTHEDFVSYRIRLDAELPADPALCAKYGIVIKPYV